MRTGCGRETAALRPPTGLGGRFFGLTGLPGQPAEPCEPEIVIDGDFDLSPYGVPGGVVLHTPGHTAGSVSALFQNGDVLAGDLAIGGISFLGGIAFKGHVRKPPFEDDPTAVRRSLLQLLDRGAERVLRRSWRPGVCEGRAQLHRPRTPAALRLAARPERRTRGSPWSVRSEHLAEAPAPSSPVGIWSCRMSASFNSLLRIGRLASGHGDIQTPNGGVTPKATSTCFEGAPRQSLGTPAT